MVSKEGQRRIFTINYQYNLQLFRVSCIMKLVVIKDGPLLQFVL